MTKVLISLSPAQSAKKWLLETLTPGLVLPTLCRKEITALRTAVDEWSSRRDFNGALTLGFLSGTNPIVDLYELKVV